MRCASLRRDERQRIGAHSITRARPSKSTAPPRPSGRVRRGRPRAVDNQKMSLRRQLLTVTITWLPAHRSRLVALRSVSSQSVRNKRHAAQEACPGVGLDGRGSSVGRNAAGLQRALHCSSASLLELKAPWEVEVTRGLASPSRPGGLNRGWPGKSYRNAAGWPKHIERTGCRK